MSNSRKYYKSTRNTDKKQLFKESIFITLLIMLAALGLQYFPMSGEIATAIREENNDFDVYDLIYSGQAGRDHKRDTNIVIFQAADTRREIAAQLNLLQKFQPKVIGVDLTFIGHSDDLKADSLLENELRMPNIITGNRLTKYSKDSNQEIIPNYFDANTKKNAGYFNFWGDEIAVVRYYPPFLKTNNNCRYSFTSRIAEKYNRSAFSELQKRFQQFQVINYRGNIESFSSFINREFDTAQLAEILPGKIVLLGVLYKKPPFVLEDLHFTPLNDKLNGKSFPDMYGVVIHANILSMILSKNYIISVARIWSYLTGLLLTFLMVHYQLKSIYLDRSPSELWFFLLQFVIVIILVYVFLFIDKKFHYKVALFPIVTPIVLCIEMIEVYKFLIRRFFKKTKYKSVYLNIK